MQKVSKVCTKCKLEKPLTEFGNTKASKDGKTWRCSDCLNEYARNRANTTWGVYKALERNQKYFHRHSSNQEKPFIITYEEFKPWYETQRRKCGYCYLPEEKLHEVNDSHNMKVNRLTIDCKENSNGYRIDNIILACNRCNFIKNDFLNYEQMFYYGQTYIKPVWEERLGYKLT